MQRRERRPGRRVLVVALGLVLGGALALGLRHLLGARGSILRHSLLLLMHAFAAHGAVARHVACGLLAPPEQLVHESHLFPSLSEKPGVSKIALEKATRRAG